MEHHPAVVDVDRGDELALADQRPADHGETRGRERPGGLGGGRHFSCRERPGDNPGGCLERPGRGRLGGVPRGLGDNQVDQRVSVAGLAVLDPRPGEPHAAVSSTLPARCVRHGASSPAAPLLRNIAAWLIVHLTVIGPIVSSLMPP